jgi:hypothetical protein
MIEKYAKQAISYKQGVSKLLVAWSSTLNVEAVCSSKTSVNFYQTTGFTSLKILLFIVTAAEVCPHVEKVSTHSNIKTQLYVIA